MSVYFYLDSLIKNNKLSKDLAIPSYLYTDPSIQTSKFKLYSKDSDKIINEKIFDRLLNDVCFHNKSKKKRKNDNKKKTRKK